MRVDVAFTCAGILQGELAGRSVAVVDVLRATTIGAALHHGARERDALRIEGFDRGDSPREMTPEALAPHGQVDLHPVLPYFHDRRVTLARGGRA